MSQSLNCQELDQDENMENVEKFREAFDCYDKNNNGRISTRVCCFSSKYPSFASNCSLIGLAQSSS